MSFIKTLAIIAIVSLTTPVWAGDKTAGEEKAVSCTACHGAGGGAPISPQYPILAGQHENYLSQALMQYRSGERKNMIM
ncbi:MAG: c-type cytochrome, partial [Gammaproteobacteria bacterium]|nr:c-type cytochrome [Gammaproteobacteria bacterium]